MNTHWRQHIHRFWHAELFSPAGFGQRALVISVIYLLVHLAGLREYTSVLNGTVGPEAAGWASSAFLGMTYIITYLAFVILVPVLILAAGMLAVWQRWTADEHRTAKSQLEKGT